MFDRIFYTEFPSQHSPLAEIRWLNSPAHISVSNDCIIIGNVEMICDFDAFIIEIHVLNIFFFRLILQASHLAVDMRTEKLASLTLISNVYVYIA